MARRRNTTIEIAERPKATRKLTAAQVARIVKLHDVPVAVSQISREVGVPIDAVRKVLVEATPWLGCD